MMNKPSEIQKVYKQLKTHSHPIPHEHDLTIREAAIIAYYEELNADLLEACKMGESFLNSLAVPLSSMQRENRKVFRDILDAAIKKAGE